MARERRQRPPGRSHPPPSRLMHRSRRGKVGAWRAAAPGTSSHLWPGSLELCPLPQRSASGAAADELVLCSPPTARPPPHLRLPHRRGDLEGRRAAAVGSTHRQRAPPTRWPRRPLLDDDLPEASRQQSDHPLRSGCSRIWSSANEKGVEAEEVGKKMTMMWWTALQKIPELQVAELQQ